MAFSSSSYEGSVSFVCRDDPRYVQGRKFMRESKYDEAIPLFESLLQSR